MQTSAEPVVIDVKEAARILRVTPLYLYQLIADKSGPPVKRLRSKDSTRPRIRIPYKKFLKWCEAHDKD